MTDLDVQIAHSVAEVDQEAWDRLSAGRPFTSYRWYRFGEQAMAYAKPCYIILSRHGEPVARATFWVTPREYMPIRPKILRLTLEAMIKRWPLLTCESPLTSIASTPGLILPDPPLRDPAVAILAQVARDLAEQHRTSFCMFGYLNERLAKLPAWPADYAPVEVWGSGTCLEIEWDDFEGYLRHLNKKRRYNIRRNQRLAEEQGIEIKAHPTVTDVDQAMALHHNVNARHKAPAEPWMRDAFAHADMVDSIWLTAEVNGQVVGCELMLGDQGAWLVTGLGLDYSVDYAYFLLGYADIEFAIEREARFLRWGSLAYDVKRRLGFGLEDNDWIVFSGRGALLRRLGRWLGNVERSHYGDAPQM